MANKETEVFAEIYGHKTKIGTATASEDGSRILKLDEAYADAHFENLTFADDEGKEPVSVAPSDGAEHDLEVKLEPAGTASTKETATKANAKK